MKLSLKGNALVLGILLLGSTTVAQDVQQTVHTQKTAATEKQLLTYYRQKQFNDLDQHNQNRGQRLYYFFKAVFANVCNQPAQSNLYLDSFEKRGVPPKHTVAYWQLRNDNYVKSFQYVKAAETSDRLTSYYRQQHNQKAATESGQTGQIWKLASNMPVQEIRYPSPLKLPIQYDAAKLMNLQVSARGKQVPFVFDTGAGLSVITQSWADSLGVKRQGNETVKIKGFTGHYTDAGVGTIETLKVGDITIHHPLFLIFPDSTLSFAGGAYKINGILGFPIAKDLGTITIGKDSIEIGNAPITSTKNLFVELLHPIVLLRYKGKEEPYSLDTGADHTQLSKMFYDKYKNDPLVKTAPLSNFSFGSAGGSSNVKVKTVPRLTFQLGTQSISLDSVQINTATYHVSGKELMGNIGQDLLRQYKKIIISFRHNYLALQD